MNAGEATGGDHPAPRTISATFNGGLNSRLLRRPGHLLPAPA